jgi:hypothetical protein
MIAAVESRLAQYEKARRYFTGLAQRLGIEGLGDPKLSSSKGRPSAITGSNAR